MARTVIVYHTTYGCDTGCCGHRVEFSDGEEKFAWAHPYGINDGDVEGLKAWAMELVVDEFGTDHAADLDWENCLVTDSC